MRAQQTLGAFNLRRLDNVPKMGTILPNMGNALQSHSNGLASALFSPTQQRVLGLLYGQPDRRWGSSEIIRLAACGTGGVHRFLMRLADAGLLEVTRVGNQKHYSAARASPIFDELHGLALKTMGLADPLRRSLEPRGSEIIAAFVYGSVAKGSDRAGSDIDLWVISDTLTYPEAFELLESAERQLARPIQLTVTTRAQWEADLGGERAFTSKVRAGARIFLLGSADDVG